MINIINLMPLFKKAKLSKTEQTSKPPTLAQSVLTFTDTSKKGWSNCQSLYPEAWIEENPPKHPSQKRKRDSEELSRNPYKKAENMAAKFGGHPVRKMACFVAAFFQHWLREQLKYFFAFQRKNQPTGTRFGRHYEVNTEPSSFEGLSKIEIFSLETRFWSRGLYRYTSLGDETAMF